MSAPLMDQRSLTPEERAIWDALAVSRVEGNVCSPYYAYEYTQSVMSGLVEKRRALFGEPEKTAEQLAQEAVATTVDCHELKVWPEQFRALLRGDKRFEYRIDDRDFKVGDSLVLRQWDPQTERYTAERCNTLQATISYIARGPAFGIPEGFVVLSIVPSLALDHEPPAQEGPAPVEGAETVFNLDGFLDDALEVADAEGIADSVELPVWSDDMVPKGRPLTVGALRRLDRRRSHSAATSGDLELVLNAATGRGFRDPDLRIRVNEALRRIRSGAALAKLDALPELKREAVPVEMEFALGWLDRLVRDGEVNTGSYAAFLILKEQLAAVRRWLAGRER